MKQEAASQIRKREEYINTIEQNKKDLEVLNLQVESNENL